MTQETKEKLTQEIFAKCEEYGWAGTTEANSVFKVAFQISLKYAEKVEEKDKAYNELGVKFDKEVERWQERDADELEKRRMVEADLDFLSLAGNDRVQSELEKAGFTNVKVTGSGSERQAIGLWPHETRTHNSLPEQVGKIRKQNS